MCEKKGATQNEQLDFSGWITLDINQSDLQEGCFKCFTSQQQLQKNFCSHCLSYTNANTSKKEHV